MRDPGAADERGRKNKRFSFASVSNALLDVVRDHVRSRSRSSALDLEGDVTPPRGRTRERSLEGEEHEEDMPHHKDWPTLGRVGEVLGLEADDHKENGDGWKEFRKGVSCFVQGRIAHLLHFVCRCLHISDLFCHPSDVSA